MSLEKVGLEMRAGLQRNIQKHTYSGKTLPPGGEMFCHDLQKVITKSIFKGDLLCFYFFSVMHLYTVAVVDVKTSDEVSMYKQSI